MEIDREKLEELLDDKFEGKYKSMADAFGIDASHLHRYMTTGVGGGLKVIGGLIRYCRDTGVDHNQYLILPKINTIKLKSITNWEVLFDMTRNCLELLVEENSIDAEIVIKTAYDILNNVGYGFTLEEVRKRYPR